MLVTNLVLETQPGRSQAVADLVGHLQGVERAQAEGDRRVLATWRFPEGHHPEPEGVSEALRSMSEEILEVRLWGEETRT
jgi:hypothetical protein